MKTRESNSFDKIVRAKITRKNDSLKVLKKLTENDKCLLKDNDAIKLLAFLANFAFSGSWFSLEFFCSVFKVL